MIVEVPVYGGVMIDSDEEAALQISPKFRLYPKVSPDEVSLHTQIGNSKIRWFRMARDIDSQGKVIIEYEDM